GCAPFVTCFAKFRMSGVTPNACEPVNAPARPKPVITSSKISKMSCFVQIAQPICELHATVLRHALRERVAGEHRVRQVKRLDRLAERLAVAGDAAHR